jgi:MYXO-CTERM domain-containing protein
MASNGTQVHFKALPAPATDLDAQVTPLTLVGFGSATMRRRRRPVLDSQ